MCHIYVAVKEEEEVGKEGRKKGTPQLLLLCVALYRRML
jgi:hypothetical protein